MLFRLAQLFILTILSSFIAISVQSQEIEDLAKGPLVYDARTGKTRSLTTKPICWDVANPGH